MQPRRQELGIQAYSKVFMAVLLTSIGDGGYLTASMVVMSILTIQ
jgi:hypothetical protein